jgi:hypothetical protein
VRDVADAHVKAATTPEAAGRRYLLLVDGPTITWRGLADSIRRTTITETVDSLRALGLLQVG